MNNGENGGTPDAGGIRGSLAQDVYAGRVRSLHSHYSTSDGGTERADDATRTAGGRTGNTYPPCTRQDVSGLVDVDESAASGLASPPGGMLLDYWRATVPATAETWAALADYVGPLTQRGGGWHSYYAKSATVLTDGVVAWAAHTGDADGADDTILIDLPGAAVAALGDNLVPFVEWCCAVGRCRRADFALDDRAGRITFERLAAAVDAGAIVQSGRSLQWVINPDSVTGERVGFTLYAGSRNSDVLFRFYDKAGERLARAGVDVGGHWVRCEMQTSGDLADSLSRAVLTDGVGAVLGELNRRIRFCEPGDDTNRRRWPLAEWWVSFLGSVEPGSRLTAGESVPASVDSLIGFLRRQCAPAMAAVTLARGGDVSWVYELIDDGRGRLGDKHLAMLAALGVAV